MGFIAGTRPAITERNPPHASHKKSGSTLVADYGIVTPILGTVVAFLTAYVAARWLVTTLKTHPLSIFGWYRIGVAVTVVALLGIGVI